MEIRGYVQKRSSPSLPKRTPGIGNVLLQSECGGAWVQTTAPALLILLLVVDRNSIRTR